MARSDKPQVASDTDANYIEFVMAPLREAWQSHGPKRIPRSLEETIEVYNQSTEKTVPDFETWRVIRNRQWQLSRLDTILAKVSRDQKDSAIGQGTLF